MEMTIDDEDANEYEKVAVKKLIESKSRLLIAYCYLNIDEMIIHCIFSQNYKNQEQDEIRSACFGHEWFSIFTACCYVCESSSGDVLTTPITVTTEGNEHSQQTIIYVVHQCGTQPCSGKNSDPNQTPQDLD